MELKMHDQGPGTPKEFALLFNERERLSVVEAFDTANHDNKVIAKCAKMLRSSMELTGIMEDEEDGIMEDDDDENPWHEGEDIMVVQHLLFDIHQKGFSFLETLGKLGWQFAGHVDGTMIMTRSVCSDCLREDDKFLYDERK